MEERDHKIEVQDALAIPPGLRSPGGLPTTPAGFVLGGGDPLTLQKPRGALGGTREPRALSSTGDQRPRQLWTRCSFPRGLLPAPGQPLLAPSHPSPGHTLCSGPRGCTHQLGQEEGVGDGEKQRDPGGHVRGSMAGGGRVPGGHALTLCLAPWLGSPCPQPFKYHLLPYTPIRRRREGKKKKKFQPSRSFHWLQPRECSVKCGLCIRQAFHQLWQSRSGRRAGASS